MERYDYHKAIKEDILEYINDHYTQEEIKERLEDVEAFYEKLYDDMFICDSVTGNASGSYTFSTWEASENICHNLHLLKDALEEFCDDYGKALEKGSEYCDVTIRCYLLGSVLYGVVNNLKREYESLVKCSFCGDWVEESELNNGLCTYCQQAIKSRGEEI